MTFTAINTTLDRLAGEGGWGPTTVTHWGKHWQASATELRTSATGKTRMAAIQALARVIEPRWNTATPHGFTPVATRWPA